MGRKKTSENGKEKKGKANRKSRVLKAQVQTEKATAT